MRPSTRVIAFLMCFASLALPASAMPGPLADLQVQLTSLSLHAPGRVGIAVKDLTTGSTTSINGTANMPAASTIKLPVMVEVFRKMSLGRFDLNRQVTLQGSDRDWGWGDLADAPRGRRYTVARLLQLMITESDNTATNMLIRLVGRRDINLTMADMGLVNTRLADYIRSSGNIRGLRTSPLDMIHLLESIAREEVIDTWSSREMIAIMSGQHHNSLLPEPLPSGLQIAHKTGTLSDTLNDVGIVYLDREPYVIAVMTTHLPSLNSGRRFIRNVSRLAYNALNRFADWRENAGVNPDLPIWQAGPRVTPLDAAAQPPAVIPTAEPSLDWEK